MNFKSFFKGAARVIGTFSIEYGDFRAQGPPAILIAVTGVVIAGGVARAIAKSADRLPETLREARGLVQALRTPQTERDTPRLHA